MPISIIVSALQFNKGNVREVLDGYMRRHGLESSPIGVELAESCMASDDDIVSAELDGLRALGVKLLVDDFGTDYSSLSQLLRMNVDVLKEDRAFTLGLSNGSEGKALFNAIVSMAEALNICKMKMARIAGHLELNLSHSAGTPEPWVHGGRKWHGIGFIGKRQSLPP